MDTSQPDIAGYDRLTMEPHDSDFKRDARAFAAAKALIPTGSPVVVGESYKRDETTYGEFPVLRSLGRCRVGFGEIQRDPDMDIGYILRVSNDYGASKIPLYWLPYDSRDPGLSTMIRLKPSKKIERDGHWASDAVHNPKWFVTWALNGCTITISGDPREPTVYHSPQVEDISERLEAFNSRYQGAPRSFDDRAVHVGPAVYNAYDEELGEMRQTIDQGRYNKAYATAVKNTTRISEGATVFGERQDGGEWHFFCQEWIVVSYEAYRPFVSNRATNERLVRRCYPIWPAEGIESATVFVNRVLVGKGLMK